MALCQTRRISRCETMAENFLYFTELAGLPVYDLKHRRIGRVRDAAIVPLIHPARVDRYLVGAGGSWLSVRYDQIATISLDGIQLATKSSTRIIPTSTCCASTAICSTSRLSTSTAARWFG